MKSPRGDWQHLHYHCLGREGGKSGQIDLPRPCSDAFTRWVEPLRLCLPSCNGIGKPGNALHAWNWWKNGFSEFALCKFHSLVTWGSRRFPEESSFLQGTGFAQSNYFRKIGLITTHNKINETITIFQKVAIIVWPLGGFQISNTSTPPIVFEIWNLEIGDIAWRSHWGAHIV